MKVKDIVHGYDLGACILAVLCILPSAVVIYMLDPLTRDSILKRAVVGLVAFLGTVLLVPTIARFTERKGLFGRDLGKRHVPSLQNVPVPEALGIVSSLSFMVSVILCQVAFASTFEEKANYNSALTSVCFMVLLGFMDDVLDLPWRAKLILPTIASLPLLITYTGPTSIVVPKPLRGLLVNASMSASSSSSSYFLKTTASAMGKKAAAAAATNKMGVLTLLGRAIDSVPYVTVDAEASGAIINLGVFYLVYMGVLAVFCTNAINIYAGINGLEAGQSYVIGCGILLYGLTQLYLMGGIAE
jgi:UDP-N-acetylglucosamine--dolichyl-phosphate N-acetylglucosaminephosphotransferase